MKRNLAFIVLAALSASGLAAIAQQSTAPNAAILAKANAIHKRILTLDTHVDVSPQLATPESDPGSDRSTQKCDLTKMEKGGLKGVFLLRVWKDAERAASRIKTK